MFNTIIYCAAEFFAHHTAKRATNKFKIHTGYNNFMTACFANSYAHAVFQISFAVNLVKSFLIRFQIGKTKKIFARNIVKKLCVFLVIKNNFIIIFTANTVMIIALGTNEKIFF